MEQKIDILSLELCELEQKVIEIGESKFRAKQIFNWLHEKNVFNFEQMTNFSMQLKEKLHKFFYIDDIIIEKKLVSNIDNTIKYLYRFYDGETAESVVMQYKHGYSICISTQVGCKMGCKFCASGIAGFIRNLSPSEMLMQIYKAQTDCNITISNIVLMGIGEPLDNYDNVIKMLNLLKEGSGKSLRHVSLSTCGIVDKINELANLNLGITLSVSLHASNNIIRNEIMPVNKAYTIETLLDACKNYFKKTGRRISFEYALIENVNDSYENAKELINLLKGLNCHVNLIPVNSIAERDFRKSKFALKFSEILNQAGITSTIRRTLGSDINAACGQLRINEL